LQGLTAVCTRHPTGKSERRRHIHRRSPGEGRDPDPRNVSAALDLPRSSQQLRPGVMGPGLRRDDVEDVVDSSTERVDDAIFLPGLDGQISAMARKQDRNLVLQQVDSCLATAAVVLTHSGSQLVTRSGIPPIDGGPRKGLMTHRKITHYRHVSSKSAFESKFDDTCTDCDCSDRSSASSTFAFGALMNRNCTAIYSGLKEFAILLRQRKLSAKPESIWKRIATFIPKPRLIVMSLISFQGIKSSDAKRYLNPSDDTIRAGPPALIVLKRLPTSAHM